jgi:hypothetical protein
LKCFPEIQYKKLEQQIVGLRLNPSQSHMILVFSLLIYDYHHRRQDLPIIAAVMDSDFFPLLTRNKTIEWDRNYQNISSP